MIQFLFFYSQSQAINYSCPVKIPTFTWFQIYRLALVSPGFSVYEAEPSHNWDDDIEVCAFILKLSNCFLLAAQSHRYWGNEKVDLAAKAALNLLHTNLGIP